MEATLNLVSVLALFSRRKALLFFSGVVTAAMAVCVAQLMPAYFSSTAGIVVETHTPGEPSGGPLDLDSIVTTQEDVLRSRGVLEHVVQELHLAGNPELAPAVRLPSAWSNAIQVAQSYLRSAFGRSSGQDDSTAEAITYLQRHLTLTAGDHSSVVTATFMAASPDMSMRVLDAIIATYIADGLNAVGLQLNNISEWANARAMAMQQEAERADQAVADYLRAHNVPEYQGAPTAVLLLTKDQEHLTQTQQQYAEAQASLDMLNQFGVSAVPETLSSRTIQQYRGSEAKTLEQLAGLGPSDPRRTQVLQALATIRSQISAEMERIASSIRLRVDLTRAVMKSAEVGVNKEALRAQSGTVDSAVLASLKQDAETKRQMAAALRASANDQAKIAASQLPPARALYAARALPSFSKAPLAGVLGFIGGVFGMGGLIVLRRAFSAKVRDFQMLTLATGLRPVGSLPEISHAMLQSPVSPGSIVAETLRALRLSIAPLKVWSEAEPRPLETGQAVLVTSSWSGEGKTTVTALLARLLTADGYRVLVVDADLRRPRIAPVLGIKPRDPSLETLLDGRATLSETVQHEPVFGADCVVARGVCSDPLRALESRAFRDMIEQAKRIYDFVIIDSPPVMRVADPMILARLSQHILFLVGAERVTTEVVSEAVKRFAAEDRAKILPMLTRMKPRDLEGSYYYSGVMYQQASAKRSRLKAS